MPTATFVRPATTVRDTLLADRYAADVNFADATNLAAGRVQFDSVNWNVVRSLFLFDLSGLPAEATITAAVLTLHPIVNIITTGEFHCYRITQPDWTENGATYNVYDGTTPWATPGGDFTDTDHDTANVTADSDPLVFSNLTPLVRDAIALRDRQLHLLIRHATEGTNDLAVNWSSEADAADPPQDPSLFPTLVVTYRLPGIDAGGFSAGMQEFSAGIA